MLDWLYTAIAWVMKQWHALFSTFLDPAGGIAWALSVVMLVVTIRVLLFRLFVKQVKSQRAMQEIQPEIQKLRKQYGSDKQGFSQAMMAMQKERGVNPLAGCLPILPQIPIFIGLFHVLRRIAPGKEGLYSWSDTLTEQAAAAKLFTAPIAASFNMVGEKERAILGLTDGSYTGIRVVAGILIIIMCFTTFYTQKQIQKRSGPVEGQAATIQKLLLYGMPISLFVSGFFFPILVLLYWFTNNLWTLGQQFYILKKLPPPGSPGALAKAEADKPRIDPKLLAPKPGAKPVRPKTGRPAVTSGPASAVDADLDGVIDTPAEGAGSTAASEGTGASRPASGTTRPRSGSSGGSAGPANRGKRKRR
ncbi:membrane protein insertase YidC [Modestobacter sp. Leaf380]|uniref:membrane protein insertase YidC n=1 Tax=Modestobacter sp. Leaf380 TaxID=1736356 RepID=UPI0006F37A52|nr:membrane protein insertase YidC [Modestobacter sp. Leaf380]KQS66849.1 preprotein translocase YidC [Modestobacter sp. Leaf380]